MCVLHLFIYMLRCWRKHELVSFSVAGWLIVALLLVESCYDQFCAIINFFFFFLLFFFSTDLNSSYRERRFQALRKNVFFHSGFSSFSLSPEPFESTSSTTCLFVSSCLQVILLVPQEKIQNNSMQSIYSTWQLNFLHILQFSPLFASLPVAFIGRMRTVALKLVSSKLFELWRDINLPALLPWPRLFGPDRFWLQAGSGRIGYSHWVLDQGKVPWAQG